MSFELKKFPELKVVPVFASNEALRWPKNEVRMRFELSARNVLGIRGSLFQHLATGLFSVLSARPNRNRLTTYTALMSAERLRMQ